MSLPVDLEDSFLAEVDALEDLSRDHVVEEERGSSWPQLTGNCLAFLVGTSSIDVVLGRLLLVGWIERGFEDDELGGPLLRASSISFNRRDLTSSLGGVGSHGMSCELGGLSDQSRFMDRSPDCDDLDMK